MTDMTEQLDPIDPVFPWPSAGGSYSADPVTGELTRLEGPDTEPEELPEE